MRTKRTIIAASGGNFGEHRDAYFNCGLPAGTERYPRETVPIDELILKASGKPSPRVCCIMTAGDDPLHNISLMEDGLKERFGHLGAEVETLRLTYYAPDDLEVRASLEVADIIYVTGGASYILNQTLKRRGVDKLLAQAAERGAVLSGLSAGLCCWFSDIAAGTHNGATTDGSTALRVSGQGWFKALVTPHWDREPYRHQPFHRILIDNPGLVGLAFDEYTAIEIRGDQYRLHQFAAGGRVYRGQYDKASGVYSFEPLEMAADLKPLSDLDIEAF